MKFGPIFYVVGYLLLALGILMLVPAVIDWGMGYLSWRGITIASGFCLVIGMLSILANWTAQPTNLTLKETFLMTTLTWSVLSVFASLPFFFTHVTQTATDSFFEAVSALTTTGATIISSLSKVSPGILLWRSLLQWVGGLGIIVMALTVSSISRVGGLQLFRSEFSDRSEKALPRVSQVTKVIFSIYSALSLGCFVLLWGTGIPFFHALCHALSTVSTGGMSTFDTSVQAFDNPWAEFIIVIFMILGSCTLILFYQVLMGNFKAFFRDTQIRTFLWMILLIPLCVTGWRCVAEGISFAQSFRESYFNTISLFTTSGFSSTDFSRWAPAAVVLLSFSFIGGCTGSTTGGLKVFRLCIAYETVKAHIYRLYQPRAIRVATYNGQEISQDVSASVLVFITLYVLTIGILTFIIAACGMDLHTSFTGAVTSLANIGSGVGDVIGPAGNYASFPDVAKQAMIIGMIVGRLEMLTVYALLTPQFWRR